MSSSADVMELVRALRHEAAGEFEGSLTTVATLLENVLEQPEEERFRTIRLSNTTFHRRLGRFSSGVGLLRALGFVDAFQDGDEPSHLALPIADPPLLAQGLVIVKAARQAHAHVAREEQPPAFNAAVAAQPSSSTSASSVGASATSNANGKRRMGAGEAEQGSGGKRQATSGASDGSALAANGSVDAPELTRQTTTVGAAVELSSYSASGIDEYFLALCGGPFLEGLSGADASSFANLIATARDAKRVASATGDAEATARAAHWASALEEHGALLGWSVEDAGGEEGDGDEEADDRGHAGSSAASVGAGAAGSGVEGASAGGGTSGSGGAAVDDEPVVVASDGNFDMCSVCGVGGLLICCEACPQAYHRECLGAQAPPDDDDDAAWFCPPCAEQLGMAGG